MDKYMWLHSTAVWQSEFWDGADKERLVEEGEFWEFQLTNVGGLKQKE